MSLEMTQSEIKDKQEKLKKLYTYFEDEQAKNVVGLIVELELELEAECNK